MNFDYVKTHYGVPAEIGRQVVVNGRCGVITKDLGHHIGVTFDDAKPGSVSPCHPTWEVQYLGIVKPRKVSRGRERYQRFLDADWGCSFIEFCKWESSTQKGSL